MERRVLALVATRKDALLTCSLLERQQIACTVCNDLNQLIQELQRGAGAVLLAEEVLQRRLEPLQEEIDRQPPWSDLPVILVTRQGADSPAVSQAISTLGNVSLIERPTRVAALLNAVRSALRARERQYQSRNYLIEREQATEALRQADRRKDEFLAMLAHELRNPLAPVRNALHVLRLTVCDEPDAEHFCEMMERQISHLVRLIDDLMEVSRITRGKVELRREQVELAAVIRTAVEASRPLIDAAGHQLAISMPAEPVVVRGDPLRLAQVVGNLLNNAAKYTCEGGQIWLSVQRERDEAVIAVRDTGVGIPTELLSQVFDPFMQADRSTNRAQGGLGIGLTLVRSLVQSHGGTVSVHSEGPNRGSEFVVRLPVIAKPAPARRLAGGSNPERLLPHRRILVVDDNVDSADSLAALLRHLGASVQAVYSGPAALEAIERSRPKFVLMDIGMPGMDGYQVAKIIRRRPEFQETVLIALTGWAQEEDRQRTCAAGFDHHLVKPADIAALRALLIQDQQAQS